MLTNLRLKQKTYDSADLEIADLVITAVGDVAMSEQIRQDAREFGLLIKSADKPSLCDFYLGSVVHKGNLKIAISTNGKSPTIAKRVKEVLTDSFPDEIEETLENLIRIRTYLKGNFTEKVKTLNRLTSTLSEKDFKSDALKNKILQCIIGLSFPALLIAPPEDCFL